jgi:uncharacterized spore protein YtfJ
VAFLVVDAEGCVSLLSMSASAGSSAGGNDLIGTISGLVDRAPSMIEKIKQIFKKDSADKTVGEPGEDEEGGAVVLNNADMDGADAKTE